MKTTARLSLFFSLFCLTLPNVFATGAVVGEPALRTLATRPSYGSRPEISDADEAISPAKTAAPTNPGASFVDATNAGFSTLGEYLAKGPKLIEEQKRADQAMEQFYKKIDRLDVEYAQMQRQYQREAAEMRKALTRLASAPIDDKTPPATSRGPVPTPTVAEAPPSSPYIPSFFSPSPVGQNNGSQDTNYAAQPMMPLAKSDATTLPESMKALDGGLESARREQSEDLSQKSTIAVQAKEQEKNGKNSLGGLVLGKQGRGISKSGGNSLRDAIKASLDRKLASAGPTGKGADTSESASQLAARSALEEMKAFTGVDGTVNANGGAGIKNEGFKMDGSDTSAEVSRLKSELSNEEPKAAPEVLGKESLGLFERVRGAHTRSQKNGRISLVHQR